jgi:hypothetical protein
MSDLKPVVKKTVKIKENDLVNLIDNIVNEAVAIKKQEWINEQNNKTKSNTTVLENKLAALELKVQKLTEGRK